MVLKAIYSETEIKITLPDQSESSDLRPCQKKFILIGDVKTSTTHDVHLCEATKYVIKKRKRRSVSFFEPDFFLSTAPQTIQTSQGFTEVPLNSIGVIMYRVKTSVLPYEILEPHIYVTGINPAALNDDVLQN